MISIEGYPVSIGKLQQQDLDSLQKHYLPLILDGTEFTPQGTGSRISKNASQKFSGKEYDNFFDKFNNTIQPGPYIESYIDSFMFQFPYKLELDTWFNVYSQYDHQQLHNHIGTNVPAFSCVVLLKQPNPDAGQFVFRQPSFSNHLKYLELDPYDQYPNIYKPPMEDGLIMIFPSCLEHYVFYNQTNESRVIFSTNIVVKREDT